MFYDSIELICVNNRFGESRRLELYKRYEAYYTDGINYIINLELIPNNKNLLEPIFVTKDCFMTIEEYREYKLNILI